TGSVSGGLAGFGAAMFAALWAYSGWQYLPMAAGEVQDPQRNLPRAIIGGSLLVLAIYLAINTAYLYALPLWQVASANSTAYPEAPSVAARAVQTFLGSCAAGCRTPRGPIACRATRGYRWCSCWSWCGS